MQVLLAQPRGFCAGVTRAIDIVERALARFGAPVYVYHEIVHNHWVVNDLRRQGAVFVDSLDEVPSGAHIVFSAHGVSGAVEAQARAKALQLLDATCPLVSKVHQQAQRFERLGYTLVMIGHAGHQEVRGTMGRVRGPMHLVSEPADVAGLNLPAGSRVAYVTQTTLSMDDTLEVIAALKLRFPDIVGPEVDDICYASQNRQVAVRELAAQVQVVLVVGARNSSNSNRLREVAQRCGVPAHLVQDASEVQTGWFDGVERVGVSAGASTPEPLVRQVVETLQTLRPATVRQLAGVQERVSFRLPAELTQEAG